ncbi:MAG: protoheme IX farnesyltransferase [Bacteroidales bacterium]|nr:protoheme IX farnesyltransferase [Bacteroidales bacterium]
MAQNKNRIFKDLLELSKVKITFAVSFTTILGYILAQPAFDSTMALTTIGLFLLACGSAALNQYQEYELDALMERTKNRPIPSGRISPTMALLFALTLIVGGSYILYAVAGFLAMQLGVLTLIWYNAIYTPLKRKTAFAVVPGSVIGALPPMVGYVAGGGYLGDPEIIAFAFFMFMWQIPHFWLLALKFGADYQKAGFPSITSHYSSDQLKKITFVWTVATAVSSLLLTVMGVYTSVFLAIILMLISIGLVLVFSKLLFDNDQKINFIRYFLYINIYLLLVMISITVGVFV